MNGEELKFKSIDLLIGRITVIAQLLIIPNSQIILNMYDYENKT